MRSGQDRFKFRITLLITLIAVISLAFEYFLDYRKQLHHVQSMVAAMANEELGYHLVHETGGNLEAVTPEVLNRIIHAHLAMPELAVHAAVRDANGNIRHTLGMSGEALRGLERVDRALSHRFIDIGWETFYPVRFSEGVIVVGFNRANVAVAALSTTQYTALLVAVLVGAYLILVFRYLRQGFEEPIKRFLDARLHENVQSIVLGTPARRGHKELAPEFLPEDIREKVNQSLALLDLWAHHKATLDRFLTISIMEVNRVELIKNLYHLLKNEFPLQGLTVLEVNQSENRLNTIFASNGPCFGEDLYSHPEACLVFRSGAQLVQSHQERLCTACICEGEQTYLCAPLVAGSRTVGVCKVVLDNERLAEYYDTVSSDHEKLSIIEAFLKPYFSLTSLTLSNLTMLDAYKNQALTDALTGLYNRRYLIEYLNGVLNISKRNQSKLSVFMIDVDNFKRLNDEFGHNVGDVVLRTLAIAMRDAIRDADVIGRYGGEEFIVALPETDGDMAMEVGERVRAAVADIDWSREGLSNLPRVTISIGVAQFPTNGYSHYHLSGAADRALYQAKEQGKNRVILYQGESQALPA